MAEEFRSRDLRETEEGRKILEGGKKRKGENKNGVAKRAWTHSM